MIERLDYEEIGFISGLEVHQQLLTAEKLFCRCPAGLYTTTHDGEILRHMRPTLSELGEYDGTALMEFKTKKEILYLLNRLNVCTYEMDDTPPFLVNQDAIDIAIQLCLSMNMDIIDEVHIARKQYLDGSIPTGFQRTAIVAVNGWMPFKGRRLTVTHVSIEEDSCREVSDKGHRIIFRTDRLGTPLTETVTGAELRNPQEVREAITLCGLVARSTGRVRTGLGAARQDINVSVRGGRRVEIKGVPRAAYSVKLTHNEAIRQVNLLKLRDAMRGRGLDSPDNIRMHSKDLSDICSYEALGFCRGVLGDNRIYGVRIEGARELAQHPTQPGKSFLDELSGRIRVIACLDESPIILGGDTLPKFQDMPEMQRRVREKLGAKDRDDVFLLCGPQTDCLTAAEEIRLRFCDAADGVPMETRQALPCGLTTFERILPGPDRMYPDTDLPPTQITPERIEESRRQLRPVPWEREKRYGSWRVPLETTHFLIRRGGAEIVDAIVEKTGADGLVAAIEIGQRAKAMKRAGIPIQRLDTDKWIEVFDLYTDGLIPREGIRSVAARMATEPELSAKQAADAEDINLQGAEKWGSEVETLIDGAADAIAQGADGKATRLITGKATAMLAGKAAAKDVALYVRQRLLEGRP
jgi:glutamyl-tRNA(Gln) amidotransferase subunit E